MPILVNFFHLLAKKTSGQGGPGGPGGPGSPGGPGGQSYLGHPESEKPCQRVSNADRKVFANPESFCDMLIIG